MLAQKAKKEVRVERRSDQDCVVRAQPESIRGKAILSNRPVLHVQQDTLQSQRANLSVKSVKKAHTNHNKGNHSARIVLLENIVKPKVVIWRAHLVLLATFRAVKHHLNVMLVAPIQCTLLQREAANVALVQLARIQMVALRRRV